MSKSDKVKNELKGLPQELLTMYNLILDLDITLCSNDKMEEWYKAGVLRSMFEDYILIKK